MSNGADGFMLKQNSDIELFTAIRNVRSGQKYINENLANDLLYKEEIAEEVSLSVFTDREVKIIRLIAGGYSNKEIAVILSLSRRTIENHRSKLMQKINTDKAAELNNRIEENLNKEHVITCSFIFYKPSIVRGFLTTVSSILN